MTAAARPAPAREADPLAARLRRRALTRAVDHTFQGLSRFGRLLPPSRPERHGVERVPDVPYRPGGGVEHRLDVWRPAGPAEGLRPVVLYAHGGGFRALSKDTHWLMGLVFARRGYVVFNANYRLSPGHRYPAPIEDLCEAWRFVAREAPRYGGDPARLVLAGESAGANLVTALAVASSYRRPEPFARTLPDDVPSPLAVLPACGVLQVTDPERFFRRRPLPLPLRELLRATALDYLPAGAAAHEVELADPLLLLERGDAPLRPLPPFFAPVGTADPLLDDTRRLAAALARLGTRCEARYYPRELHAFHALVWRPAARQCWADMMRFLDGVPGVAG